MNFDGLHITVQRFVIHSLSFSINFQNTLIDLIAKNCLLSETSQAEVEIPEVKIFSDLTQDIF